VAKETDKDVTIGKKKSLHGILVYVFPEL